ncbi:tropomyosin alpha-1 chain-like [Pituophis catenifer annectens]|uniref:tropomyosin alpha-1 chain-like n=1 Tax=Pituophis catenifer annectens TaxID=94852 RepID=UPI003995965C
MGKQIPDVCGPLSPKAKLQAEQKDATCYTGMKLRICCAILFAIPFLLWLVFLSLYLQHLYSDPVNQLKECKAELQNQTSQMRASLGSMEKRVEETGSDLEKARVERDGLRADLEAANRSLVKARVDWGSCQEHLKSVEKNATSQMKEAVLREMEKNKVAEEEIKHLKEQLSNLQQMKDQQQKEIQHLEDQLMKHKPLERSKGGLLLGSSMVLLPLLLAALLL